MTTLKATIRGGRLELDAPPGWPDGTEVEIHRLPRRDSDAELLSPDEIAQTLAAMDQVEAFDWTDAERAAWAAEGLARREREKAEFSRRAEQLGSQWE